MTNGNWLERVWNSIQGLTHSDFENCEKLFSLTGLGWRPQRLKSKTIYFTNAENSNLAKTLGNKLNDLLLSPKQQARPVYGFTTEDNRTQILATTLQELEVKDDIDLGKVKNEIASAVRDGGEDQQRKRNRMLLNNIPL